MSCARTDHGTRPLAPAFRTAVLALVSCAAPLAAARPAAPTPPGFERQDGAAVDGQSVVHPATPRKQVVAVIPDRTTGRDWGLRYLREAVEDFNREKPDAVFCVGDLVQGYSRDHGVVRRERDDFLSIVGRLSMPFYPTPGNHDLVSGRRDPSDRSFADEYRALFGPLYYSVELELASFVVLNTEDGPDARGIGRIQPGFSDAQLAWLDRELARLARRDRPIVLLFHRPLWDVKSVRWDERVQPLLVRHGVDQVIAGHYHSLQQLPPRDGIPFLLLGTCGGAIDQHPLAGQLQHTTFVTIDDTGRIDIHHQIAGTTLPSDWITQEDQARAYRLKSARDSVELRGASPEPFGRIGETLEGEVEVVFRNPLDRPVELRAIATRAPTPWTVVDATPDGPVERSWTSRTPIDVFNPYTTDLDTPFELEFPKASTTVAPGAEAVLRVGFRCEGTLVPPGPAPFDLVATYEDERGRRVPIVLRQRLPIARRATVGRVEAEAPAFPIAVWRWSEYDTPEANATVRFVEGQDADDLRLVVEVPDLVHSPDIRDRDARSELDDPLGDAVRIELGEGPGRRAYLVTFPADKDAPRVRRLDTVSGRLVDDPVPAATFVRGPDRWRLVVDLPGATRPEGLAWRDTPVNVGVADNDETYHTQWRWLAPASIPARLRPVDAPPEPLASPSGGAGRT
jgi:3',5'-cyclic AMP phosphodiesterase CpdA